MYRLELNDIMFFINSYKNPVPNFMEFFEFVDSRNTRSVIHHKLKHSLSSTSLTRHSYFSHLPQLWNSLPPIDLQLSPNTIRIKFTKFMFNHFHQYFNSDNSCSFHLVCPCTRYSTTSHPTIFTPL